MEDSSIAIEKGRPRKTMSKTSKKDLDFNDYRHGL